MTMDAVTGFMIVFAAIFGTVLLILLVDWSLMQTHRHHQKRYEREKAKNQQESEKEL